MRVWNLTDLSQNPIVMEVGGVRIGPGGGAEVCGNALRNLSRRYGSGSFSVGAQPPPSYRRKKNPPTPVAKPEPVPEVSKKSRRKKKKKDD